MTNSETIENAKMLHGIEEELHTFAKWKELGYIRKRTACHYKKAMEISY